jgi:hypothetical protein
MMMMRTCLITLYLSFIFSTAVAQLSPPGMGETRTAFWSALGIKQSLDEKNTSTTYVGLGRISGAKSNNSVAMPSIFVVNQEFYHKLGTQWNCSMALSYRRQHEYDESFDAPEAEAINQEFRLYGRLQHIKNFGNLKWATTLRQEVRKFYTEDFAQVPDGLQLRTRLKTQFLVPLDADAQSSLMGSAEALFAMADDSNKGWGSPAYKESRFCLYYCYSPASLPITFDIGYMNDLIGYGQNTTDVSYLAMDIIVANPF